MRPAWRERALVATAVAWVILAAVWTPAAVFSVDGFVYHAMIDAAAKYGSFNVENGFGQYRNTALALTLLNPVGGELAPQYPGLWGFFAAPAYMLGGLRGVMVLQSVCAALSLFFVWRAAHDLTEDRPLAANAALIFSLASFFVVYVAAIWPHAAAMACVTAAIWAAVRSAPAGAAMAGLVLGLGVNFRVDAIFVAPALAVWMLGFGRRPYLCLFALLAGLAPGLLLSGWINWLKFGAFAPISYGPVGGATNLSAYRKVAVFVAAGAAGALLLGVPRARSLLSRPGGWTILLLGAAAVVAATGPGRDLVERVATGFWVLMVDFQQATVKPRVLSVDANGVQYTYGVIKHALFQSLPYAPLALIPIAGAFGRHGRATALCVAVAVIPAFPFLLHSWHGGLSLNMRYFLHALPALAILSALALDRVRVWAGAGLILPAAAMLAIFVYGVFRLQTARPPLVVAQLDLPNAALASCLALTLMTLALRGDARRIAAQALRGVAAAGLVVAFALGWLVDLRITNLTRSQNIAMARLTSDLPRDALLILFSGRNAAMRLNDPPALTAQADFRTKRIGPELAALVARALAEGRPVFAQSRELAGLLETSGVALPGQPRYGIPDVLEVYPMLPPPKDRPANGS